MDLDSHDLLRPDVDRLLHVVQGDPVLRGLQLLLSRSPDYQLGVGCGNLCFVFADRLGDVGWISVSSESAEVVEDGAGWC